MEKKEMSMAQRRAAGLLWVDTGENMNQQVYARGLCQDFNHTRGTETEKREEILQKLFAFCGEGGLDRAASYTGHGKYRIYGKRNLCQLKSDPGGRL